MQLKGAPGNCNDVPPRDVELAHPPGVKLYGITYRHIAGVQFVAISVGFHAIGLDDAMMPVAQAHPYTRIDHLTASEIEQRKKLRCSSKD